MRTLEMVPKVAMDLTAKEDKISCLEAMQDHATLADEQFSLLENNQKNGISSD